MTNEQDSLLRLIRTALGNEAPSALKGNPDWEALIKLARKQEVSALACDGLQAIYNAVPALHTGLDEQKALRFEWFSDSVNSETSYAKHEKIIRGLSRFYARHGLEMMVLKGYGLSLDYPSPSHRHSGDVDIYLFSDGSTPGPAWKEGDRALREEKGVKIDTSHHHHSVFKINGVGIENHFDFINVWGHRSSRAYEKLLKQRAAEPSRRISIDDAAVLLPSDNFNALFLVKHNALHFASGELTLRQILDWAIFVRNHGKDLDWKAVYAIYDKFNLSRFVNILNSIAVEYLGFRAEEFFSTECDTSIREKVLSDMFEPAFTEKEDGTLLKGLWVKPRRWWAHRWKHRLCYNDSLLSGFIYTLFAKIIKPAHFKH